MLSAQALEERMWAPFPVLRQALQGEKVPDLYYGFTSVSDNMFDRIQRAATLVVLIKEFRPKITEIGRLVGKEKMLQDLQLLQRIFEHEGFLFKEGIEIVRKLAADL